MIDSASVSQPSAAGTTRRTLLARTGLSALGLGMLGMLQPQTAAAVETTRYGVKGHKFEVNDNDILNFALNFEYIGAEYYLHASSNSTLRDEDITGTGTQGTVTGGAAVPFTSTLIAQLAAELAGDEQNHVQLLRSILEKKAIARPAIDFTAGFAALATAAGLSNASTFNPFGNERDFLLGGFLLEDVCVTALHGAAPYIHKSSNVIGSTGLLGTEGYHAAAIRTNLIQLGQTDPTVIADANLIAAARQKASTDADGAGADDQGITNSDGTVNIVPADANSVAFARTFAEVLNIAYLENANGAYGFFPNKVNGRIS